MRCAECGTVSEEHAVGSRSYRSDVPPEAEPDDPTGADVPTVVVFCGSCSAGEFGDGASDW